MYGDGVAFCGLQLDEGQLKFSITHRRDLILAILTIPEADDNRTPSFYRSLEGYISLK